MDAPNLVKSYRQQILWPSVHSAVDVFVKREASGAEPFELTWRLIHIWECVVISIAEGVIAKWMDEGRESELKVVREKAYGRTWNESEARLEIRIGALDGSLDRWIEIVDYIVRSEPRESPFLSSAIKFLDGESATDPPIDIAPFLSAWGRACDVTPGLEPESVPVRRAMKAINSFRNRLAHVPFPYDPMDSIYGQLLRCTDELFGADPAPFTQTGALAGGISSRSIVIRGATVIPNPIEDETCGEVCYVFGLQSNAAAEVWPASLFVHVDKMLRPYVLTRLKNDQGLWEYTRYLAESNAVVTIRSRDFPSRFSIPEEAEYKDEEASESEKDETSSEQPETDEKLNSMVEATAAIRQRHFRPAIEFLTQLTKQRPQYHVGWLRLGHARRELAVELMHDHEAAAGGEVNELLSEALSALERASDHRDASYQAEARYQTSKTFYRKWNYSQDQSDFQRAIAAAREAIQIYPESRYESWIEYLESVEAEAPESR